MAGSLAGAPVASLITPIDLIKTRLQVKYLSCSLVDVDIVLPVAGHIIELTIIKSLVKVYEIF